MKRPAEAVVLAFEHVQGFSGHEREAVLDLLTQSPRPRGRPWTELAARAPTLTGRAFTWPEFDRWQAFFAACETFPVRWEGLQVAPPVSTPAADDYQRRKLDLLFEWLDALMRRRLVLAHYRRRGLGARIARQDPSQACAICAPFDARPVRSGRDAMPPFRPGCRCVLLAVGAARARR